MSAAYETEIPLVYLDAVVEDTFPSRINVVNFDPEPGEVDVYISTAVRFRILDLGPSPGISLSATKVWVDGALAYDGNAGGFQTGFSGTVTAWFGSGYDFSISKATTYSAESVTVRIYTRTTDLVDTVDWSYLFYLEDVLPPRVDAVAALTPFKVRITWNEDVLQESATGVYDALNPANYYLSAQNAPAFVPEPASVESYSSMGVEVTFASELTFGCSYLLTVSNVKDLQGNISAPPYNSGLFVAVTPDAPAGRNFNLYDMLPNINKAEDRFGTGDMLKFVSCLQEALNVLLYELDGFLDILDPEFAAERYLDAMLEDLANPFAFDFDEMDKRRLLLVLVAMYGQKGTGPGIINAVRFFMSVDVTVVPYTSDALYLGESELGYDWVLGPSGSWALYAFEVTSPVTLTDEQVARLTSIVNYMKPCHTHFVRLNVPEPPVIIDHVELGLSDLGENWELH